MKIFPHLGGLILMTACLGCRRGMVDQPRYDPLETSVFFSDGAVSRPPPAHTVARGDLQEDALFFTGKTQGRASSLLPEPVTPGLLKRGRERFEIFCTECHGRLGDGRGMVVLRGFPAPPSLHEKRLRDAPIGHFFEVITEGYGVMYSYAARVPPADRWAISAYIRALQLSQNATVADADPVWLNARQQEVAR